MDLRGVVVRVSGVFRHRCTEVPFSQPRFPLFDSAALSALCPRRARHVRREGGAIGATIPLFDLGPRRPLSSVSPDGQRFLIVEQTALRLQSRLS
jgi:hypothetical protein